MANKVALTSSAFVGRSVAFNNVQYRFDNNGYLVLPLECYEEALNWSRANVTSHFEVVDPDAVVEAPVVGSSAELADLKQQLANKDQKIEALMAELSSLQKKLLAKAKEAESKPAPEPEPEPVDKLAEAAELMEKLKKELVALCKSKGVEVEKTDNKAALVAKLLDLPQDWDKE